MPEYPGTVPVAAGAVIPLAVAVPGAHGEPVQAAPVVAGADGTAASRVVRPRTRREKDEYATGVLARVVREAPVLDQIALHTGPGREPYIVVQLSRDDAEYTALRAYRELYGGTVKHSEMRSGGHPQTYSELSTIVEGVPVLVWTLMDVRAAAEAS